MPIKIVDPHCHFWRRDLGYYTWLDQPHSALLGSLSRLKKDYLPSDYLTDTRGLSVANVIVIEAAATRFCQAEVNWLTQLAETSPLIGGVVAGIDLLDDSAPDVLATYGANPLVRGVRQLLNWHQDPIYTAAKRPDDLKNPAWQQRYGLLSRYQLSFDLQICPLQMQAAYQLARKYPDVPLIINHAGLPIPGEFDSWQHGLQQLAACPQVFIKLSGFGMLNHHWTTQRIAPYVKTALDCFGVDRCLFAGNFPVDGLYGRFDVLFQAYYDLVQALSPAEMNKLFHDNAKRIYRINEDGL